MIIKNDKNAQRGKVSKAIIRMAYIVLRMSWKDSGLFEAEGIFGFDGENAG